MYNEVIIRGFRSKKAADRAVRKERDGESGFGFCPVIKEQCKKDCVDYKAAVFYETIDMCVGKRYIGIKARCRHKLINHVPSEFAPERTEFIKRREPSRGFSGGQGQ